MTGHSSSYFRALLVCVGALAMVGCQSASQSATPRERETLERTSKSGDAQMVIRLTPSEPKLSDLVELKIEVSAPDGVVIEPPTFGQSVGDFAVREYGEKTMVSSVPVESGTPSTRVFRYLLEPMFSGRHLIRTIPVIVTDRRGQDEIRSILQSDPIEVEVTSELDPSATDLTSVDPMFDPFGRDRGSSAILWISLGTVVLSIVAVLIAIRKRAKKKIAEPVLTAQESARAELDKLLSEELPRKGMVKEFYLRLTGIVRTYIEGSTGLKAPEQTTEEFLVAMRASELFSANDSLRLQDFLEAADMVKYAGQQPSITHVEDSAQKAREFISIPFMVREANGSMQDTAGPRISPRMDGGTT